MSDTLRVAEAMDGMAAAIERQTEVLSLLIMGLSSSDVESGQPINAIQTMQSHTSELSNTKNALENVVREQTTELSTRIIDSMNATVDVTTQHKEATVQATNDHSNSITQATIQHKDEMVRTSTDLMNQLVDNITQHKNDSVTTMINNNDQLIQVIREIGVRLDMEDTKLGVLLDSFIDGQIAEETDLEQIVRHNDPQLATAYDEARQLAKHDVNNTSRSTT